MNYEPSTKNYSIIIMRFSVVLKSLIIRKLAAEFIFLPLFALLCFFYMLAFFILPG